jgi:hypothetical protein
VLSARTGTIGSAARYCVTTRASSASSPAVNGTTKVGEPTPSLDSTEVA